MSDDTRKTLLAVFMALVCVGFGYFLRGVNVSVGLAESVAVATRNQVRAEAEREAVIVEANKALEDLRAQLAEAEQE